MRRRVRVATGGCWDEWGEWVGSGGDGWGKGWVGGWGKVRLV